MLNHTLSPEQKLQAEELLGVESFVVLPGELAAVWAGIDPELRGNALPVGLFVEWLTATTVEGDYVLAQGDFGMTFGVVYWCLGNGRKAVYATTRREAQEIDGPDGVEVKRVFRHVRFRAYVIPTGG